MCIRDRVSSGFEADSENGASGTASFRAEGVAGMTKSLSQTVYPANRSSYTLSAQIGSARLSFAKAEYMQQLLDITPGSVSVLGLMNDTAHKVQLLIDEGVLASEYVGCHPCINTSSLRFATSDLIHQILPALNETFTTVKL